MKPIGKTKRTEPAPPAKPTATEIAKAQRDASAMIAEERVLKSMLLPRAEVARQQSKASTTRVERPPAPSATQPVIRITASEVNEMLRAMPPVPLYGEPPCACALCAAARAEGTI